VRPSGNASRQAISPEGGDWLLVSLSESGAWDSETALRRGATQKRPLQVSVLSVQLIEYKQPARGPLLKLLGVRPGGWQREDPEESQVLGTRLGLRSVMPLLDFTPMLSEDLKSNAGMSSRAEVGAALRLGSLCALPSWLSAMVLSHWPTSAFLSRKSALFLQCRARLELQGRWIGLLLRAKSQGASGSARLDFFSSVSVVACDMMLGVAACRLLNHTFSAEVLASCSALHHWTYGKALVSLVTWLMGAPADFKLNRELTSFAGGVCMSMFSLWEKCAAELLGPRAGLLVFRAASLLCALG
ncbi:unnamed protein product, partial [Polarella glacialis]